MNLYKEAGKNIVKEEMRNTTAVNEYNHDNLLNYNEIYRGKECAVAEPDNLSLHKKGSLRRRSSLHSFNEYLDRKARELVVCKQENKFFF